MHLLSIISNDIVCFLYRLDMFGNKKKGEEKKPGNGKIDEKLRQPIPD